MKDEELDMLIANVEYEPQQLKDYITNLQKENEKLSNIINEFEIWLSNEIKFQRVIDRDYELTKTWFNLQNIKENILTGGDE